MLIDESEILGHLIKDLKASAKQASMLLDGLYAAEKRNKDSGNVYFNSVNINGYKTDIQNAYNAIKKVNYELRKVDRKNKILLDEYYLNTSKSDDSIDALHETMKVNSQLEPILCPILESAQQALKLNLGAIKKNWCWW